MTTKRQTVNFNKNYFENDAWINKSLIVGIDEVGRGCFAGPLVTAAVILPPHKTPRILKDSKILSEEEREKAAAWIEKNCLFTIGIVHNRIIDQHNIWQATLIAMKKAVVHLLAIAPEKPSTIVVDAMPLSLSDMPFFNIPIHYFPKGESKSSSIAAASIIAKVTRDRIMKHFDELVPGYHFANNKGYGTKAHRMAIEQCNYSILHRMNYIDDLLHNVSEKSEQLELP